MIATHQQEKNHKYGRVPYGATVNGEQPALPGAGCFIFALLLPLPGLPSG